MSESVQSVFSIDDKRQAMNAPEGTTEAIKRQTVYGRLVQLFEDNRTSTKSENEPATEEAVSINDTIEATVDNIETTEEQVSVNKVSDIDVGNVIHQSVINKVVADPEVLVRKGICSDVETAMDIATKLQSGEVYNLDQIDEVFLDNLKSEMDKASVSNTIEVTSTEVPAAKHIPDNIIPNGAGGVLDFSLFGIPPVSMDDNNTPQTGNFPMTPEQGVIQGEAVHNPYLDHMALMNQGDIQGEAVHNPYLDHMALMNQGDIQGAVQVNPEIQQPVPVVDPVQPVVQQVQQQPPVMHFQRKLQKADPADISITNIPPTDIAEPPVLATPSYIQKNIPIKDSPVSLHDPNNDELISKYKWLGQIEKISNDLGQPIKFVELSKYNAQEPCGLIHAVVYTSNGQYCEPKSFTIDASGVMYDKRPKFFPVLTPGDGKTYEDYPAYLIMKGGKENPFNEKDVKDFLTGGVQALGKWSAYRPEYYQLNKVIDLSSMPTNRMHSDMRKRIQNRLSNAFTGGVFGAALSHDELSRWRFERFDRDTERFTLTNVGTPWRFNSPCFAKTAVKIVFSDGEATIKRYNTLNQ